MSNSGDSDEVVGLDQDWFESHPSRGSKPRESKGRSPGWVPWLTPEFLLCTGFFLGPPGTFVASLAVAPRDLSVRRVAFFLGLAGACWLAIQGGTVMTMERYGEVVLRVARTVVNLGLGAGILAFWLRQFDGPLLHPRSALVRTGVIALLFATFFVFLPAEWLFYLGR